MGVLSPGMNRTTVYAGSLAFPVALALGLATSLSRLLFVRPTPVNWDAVQFELALGQFNLSAHQPHPPGYILYVLAGRAVGFVVPDPGIALSLLSALASGLSVSLLYSLAQRVFKDQVIAIGAALLLLASPLAIYYGSVGLTYAPEMALSTLVALLAWERKQKSSNAYLPALLGAALALSGGVRQTSIAILLPVCLWAMWGAKRGAWLGFALTATVTGIAWLVPLIAMSGGLATYLRENALLAETVSARTSVFEAGLEGLATNAGYIALALGLGLAFGLVPLGLWASRTVRFSLAPGARGFFLLLILSPVVFYTASHVGQFGYALVAVPPLLLLASVAIRVLAERIAVHLPVRGAGSIAIAIYAALALLSAGYFLAGRGPVTANAIIANDEQWNATASALEGLDPAHTALVMSVGWDGPFRHAGFLLPGFHSYAAQVDPDQPRGWLYSAYGGHSNYALPRPKPQPYLALPDGTQAVVALDAKLGEMLAEEAGLRRVPVGSNSIYVLKKQGATIKGMVIEERRVRPDYGLEVSPH